MFDPHASVIIPGFETSWGVFLLFGDEEIWPTMKKNSYWHELCFVEEKRKITIRMQSLEEDNKRLRERVAHAENLGKYSICIFMLVFVLVFGFNIVIVSLIINLIVRNVYWISSWQLSCRGDGVSPKRLNSSIAGTTSVLGMYQWWRMLINWFSVFFRARI